MTEVAHQHGDSVLPFFSESLQLDEQRHWAWARALAEMVHADDHNVHLTQAWVDTWYPRAHDAVAELGAIFESAGASGVFDTTFRKAKAETRASFAVLTRRRSPQRQRWLDDCGRDKRACRIWPRAGPGGR